MNFTTSPFDTVAALATPVGEGGIAVIRISGTEAFAVLDRIFRRMNGRTLQEFKSHMMYLGHIYDGDTVVDEVLAVKMKAPRSYTAEDVAEIHCHGGLSAAEAILTLCCRYGARLAGPGEFTKRAFLNGRLDLTQAEAVMDTIASKSELSLKTAARQLKGDLREKIQALRQELLLILARLEAGIDFPDEEDVKAITDTALIDTERVSNEVETLLKTAKDGEIMKNGIKAAFLGRVNVGKSSLLNALIGSEKALVTNIPGTTRDAVEGILRLDGLILTLIDTAGVRETDDTVEQLGIRRSLSRMQEADLVLFAADMSEALTDEDIALAQEAAGRKVILIGNKTDLSTEKDLSRLQEILHPEATVTVSARTGEGIEPLKKAIRTAVFEQDVDLTNNLFISNRRQAELLEISAQNLHTAREGLEMELPPELPAQDLMEAYRTLGEVIGETYEDDLLDKIFSEFCIGK